MRRLRIAIQKKGRLAEKSIALLIKSGLDFDFHKDRLIYECQDFPIDLMLVRDDDIPEYVADGVCELGIAGENVVLEKGSAVDISTRLGFGTCRLSLAFPAQTPFPGLEFLESKRIATSYPNILKKFLRERGLSSTVVELQGSVEIAPALQIADAVFDLVSTGGTMRSNDLREVHTVLESQAVLIRTRKMIPSEIEIDLQRLLQRIVGVLRASQSKYIMMNAPRSALKSVQEILPGMEEPSILPLSGGSDRIAIHAVARETIFWDTIERLKAVGASSILVLPIEKVIA